MYSRERKNDRLDRPGHARPAVRDGRSVHSELRTAHASRRVYCSLHMYCVTQTGLKVNRASAGARYARVNSFDHLCPVAREIHYTTYICYTTESWHVGHDRRRGTEVPPKQEGSRKMRETRDLATELLGAYFAMAAPLRMLSHMGSGQ